MFRPVSRFASPFLVLMAFCLAAPSAEPCAPAPPPGEWVGVRGEEAIIVWNPASGMQHFVRRADFYGDAEEFGFLVPTPTVPELAEADDAAFDRLRTRTKQRVIVKRPLKFEPVLTCLFPFQSLEKAAVQDMAMTPAVEVVSVERVGDYEAAVLRASDPALLRGWLDENGYDARPELEAWFQPYTEAGWIITAFKIATDEEQLRPATRAVRMSFETKRPFFPYREPADQRSEEDRAPSSPYGGRQLDVHFIGPERVEGTIGEKTKWPVQLRWSKPVASLNLEADLEGAVPADVLPTDPWLTTFRDSSNPRPGTADLFFTPAKEQKPFELPPKTRVRPRTIPIPVDLLILIGAGIGLFVFILRRRDET